MFFCFCFLQKAAAKKVETPENEPEKAEWVTLSEIKSNCNQNKINFKANKKW